MEFTRQSFDDGLSISTHTAVKSRQATRDEIQRQIEAFVAAGGTIEKVAITVCRGHIPVGETTLERKKARNAVTEMKATR